jgi:hypothetical protein
MNNLQTRRKRCLLLGSDRARQKSVPDADLRKTRWWRSQNRERRHNNTDKFARMTTNHPTNPAGASNAVASHMDRLGTFFIHSNALLLRLDFVCPRVRPAAYTPARLAFKGQTHSYSRPFTESALNLQLAVV